MRRTCIPVLAAFLLLGMNAAAQTPNAPAPWRRTTTYTVIDLMPAFWAFYDKAESLAVPEQAKQFEKSLVERYPEVYNRKVLTLDDSKPFPEQIQERYAKWHGLVADRIPLMRRLSTQIATDLPRYEGKFRTTFPDFDYRGEVYFLTSLGGFDGATREAKGRTALLFGIDMIAYVYGEKVDPQPFFHHELFHIYHSQFMRDGDDDPLYLALWREGLAEYVAKELNPTAEGVTLFGLPADMPSRAQAILPQLARELRSKMDSTSQDDYARFFFGKSKYTDLPGRSGYYVGYLVVQKIARGQTLRELARMQGAELHKRIEQALTELAAEK